MVELGKYEGFVSSMLVSQIFGAWMSQEVSKRSSGLADPNIPYL